MKTPAIQTSALALVFVAFAVTNPQFTTAQAPASAALVTTPAPALPAPNVSGKVEAKTDHTLTVAGRTVSINSATTFSRGGASIGHADLKLGDKVNIVTSNDGQVAVSVTAAE